MDLLESCSECYQFQLSEFPANIIIAGNLSPRTIYFLKVTDKFNNANTVECPATDMNGTLSVPVPDSWSAGWFNRNNGLFNLEVSLQSQPWEPIDFAFEASEYSPFYPCIQVEFVNDNTPITIIQ